MTAAVLSTFLVSFAIVDALTPDDEFPGKIICFDYVGREFGNNTQCSGSHICCQTSDLCQPNRFCKRDGQLIIPACSTHPWDNCANICKYGSKANFTIKMLIGQFDLQIRLGTTDGILPRAVECDDGSFCCDDDPPCCAENRGIKLDGNGAPYTTNPGLSSTSTTASATSILAEATDAATQSTTSENEVHDDTLSTGAKAGIGLGAAVAAVAMLLIAFLLIRRRKRKAISDPNVQARETTPAWLVDPKVRQELDIPLKNQQYGSPAPSYGHSTSHFGEPAEMSSDNTLISSPRGARQHQGHMHELGS